MKLQFSEQQRNTNTYTAFVEPLNKLLTEEPVKVLNTQESNDPQKVSSTWVKHMYGLVDKLMIRKLK